MNTLSFFLLKTLLIFLLILPIAALLFGFGYNLVDSGPVGLIVYVLVFLALILCCGNGIVATLKWKQNEIH